MAVVKERVETSIDRLAPDSIQILNLVIPKPEIPPDIAANYKQVKVRDRSVIYILIIRVNEPVNRTQGSMDRAIGGHAAAEDRVNQEGDRIAEGGGGRGEAQGGAANRTREAGKVVIKLANQEGFSWQTKKGPF